MDQEKDIWLIIAADENGIISPEEKAILVKWINESEENKQFYNTIKHIVPEQKRYTEETKARVYAKIKEVIEPKKVRHQINFWKYSVAASLALIIMIGTIFLSKKFMPSSETAYIETQVPFGIKSKISLSDGTVVHLNSGSYLRYPAKFSDEQRLVILKGEAYFEVQKDSKHPFIVQTDKLNIKVFGTHFNVKAFDDDEYIETTLLEGSVGVYTKPDVEMERGIILKPNQQVVYNIASGKMYLKQIDSHLSVAWKDGKYYFENETLASIFKKIERNFNVHIKFTSKELGNELFYGFLVKNKNIFQLLDAIKIHGNFNYTSSNDTIFINKN